MTVSIPSTVRSWSASRWLALAILLLVTVAVYLQTLSFDFVTYDDHDLIVQNADFLSHRSNILTAFGTHVFTGHRAESPYYRPILLASFIGDYQLWKLAPSGYHFMNILLHLLTATVVFLTVCRLTGDRTTGFFSGLLFSLHPVQTETVAWISGRNDLLLALFVTLAFLLFVGYRHNPHRRIFFAGSLTAFVLALFTKESAVFYALLYPLYDICFRGPSGNKVSVGKKTAEYFLIAVSVAGYMAVRAHAIGTLVGAEQFAAGTTLTERILRSPGLFTEHLMLLIAPYRLSVAHPAEESFWLQPAHQPFCYGLLLMAAVAGWWCRRYDRVAFFGFLWMMIGFLPLLNILPVAVPVLEHRLYLPVVGFAILVSRLVTLFLQRMNNERAAVAILGMLAIICGITAWDRLPVWKNSETLWRDAIEKAPSYSRSYLNLAGYYYEQQQYDRTIDLMKSYIRLRPDDPMGYSKLRQTYYATGNFPEAARLTRAMIGRTPGNIERYVEAAELYLQANLPDSVLAVYEQGLGTNPNSFQLHDLAGRASVRLLREKDAERHYRRAIELNPQYDIAYFDLGVLCASQGDYANAIAQIEDGMKFGTPPTDIIQFLYQLYRETNQNDKAENLRKRFPQ
jgi:tetratricopeptide (TPR) repeat protein